jgi:hypothetical protein
MTAHESGRFGANVGLNPRLEALIERSAQAKRMAGSMYAALRARVPGAQATLALARLVSEEEAHAADLAALRGGQRVQEPIRAAGLAGCSPHGESWASGLMAAFALDQAVTAALVALATSPDEPTAALARRIVNEERDHQTFALGAFRALAREDPALGPALAREMIVDRDWVKQVYPRRGQLVALAEEGLLAADAPRAHDAFLASLGDRIQDALSVLGDL